MGNALGIAGGAILLRVAALARGGEGVTAIDFHIAFWAIGAVGLIGVWHFRRLASEAGAALKARPVAGKA
jgi:hypothetical protein